MVKRRQHSAPGDKSPGLVAAAGGRTISVIMPAYNAAQLLSRTLTPILEMLNNGEISEVLVVDDRSTDDTAQRAAEMGAQVLVTPVNGGPGAARNLASQQARGDILWFIDSDVIVHRGAAAHVVAAFADPAIGAVFGSYDDAPADPHWFSRYKNLMHRYYHQEAGNDATTFWAGCGAVRRDVFNQVGGFDIESYPYPSIEDIELGYRIVSAGYQIRIDPDMLGKHLKAWRIPNAVFTDIFRRALPWSRLMIAREGVNNDLNTGLAERLKAGIALILLLSLVALPFNPSLWPLVGIALVSAVVANLKFARFLYAQGGARLAVPAVLYHQLYFVYAAAVFCWCLFEFHVLGQRNFVKAKTTGAPEP